MPPSRRSSKQSSSEKSTSPGTKKSNDAQSQWIMMVEDCVLDDDGGNEESRPVMCKLRHPKSDSGCLFLFANGGQDVYEAIQYKEEFRSWFIGDTVQHDGGMLMLTTVDPLFLVMPYLLKEGQSGKFMTLDQIVIDEDYPECNRLHGCTGLSELHQITEVKGDDDFRAYRFDKDKTLSWLKLKTEIVADVLQQKDVSVSSSGAHSSIFIRSKKEDAVDKDQYIKYACGMVSDYLPPLIAEDLRDYLGVADIHDPIKSPSEEPPAKRVKLEDIAPSEDYSKTHGVQKQTSKETKMTVAQKKLSKVDKSGMKSISSFFSPKVKT
ncbi:ribonuclease H2 subunit B-like [Haliotis cracherodii]|uniref:ribonuclease H2 subunit B-like n=1 Tax=Haliotis cracherodii TaxID=6455 RepID=UPI0039ECFFB4